MITAEEARKMAAHPYEDEISSTIKDILKRWIEAEAKRGIHKLSIDKIYLQNETKWNRIAIWLESYGYKCHFQGNNSIEEFSLIIAW